VEGSVGAKASAGSLQHEAGNPCYEAFWENVKLLLDFADASEEAEEEEEQEARKRRKPKERKKTMKSTGGKKRKHESEDEEEESEETAGIRAGSFLHAPCQAP
jgi:hypothetical protein